jgi:hypothetical protein
MKRTSRFATTVVVSGALSLASLGLGAGTAMAQPPPVVPDGYTWCPGQALPFSGLGWDMDVCHTYSFVPFRQGNADGRPARQSTRELDLGGYSAPAAY